MVCHCLCIPIVNHDSKYSREHGKIYFHFDLNGIATAHEYGAAHEYGHMNTGSGQANNLKFNEIVCNLC